MEEKTQHPPPHFTQNILAALQAWRELSFTRQNGLNDLLLVRQFRAETDRNDLSSRRMAVNRVLDQGLAILDVGQKESATLLRRKFIDGESHSDIAQPDIGISVDAIKGRQRKGIGLLAKIIWELEINARKERREQLINGLPLMKRERVFGVERQVEQVVELLLNPHQDHIVAIWGIGGIGKTTLVQTAVYRIIDQFHFDHILWIHIDNQKIQKNCLTLNYLLNQIRHQMNQEEWATLSVKAQHQQIRYKLASSPHLIVIDNLEKEIALDLLLQLQEWSTPSRFLITSRLDLPRGSAVYPIQLNQLTLEATAALIQNRAQQDGAPELSHLSQAEIAPIFEVVGGNPLAIKLIVGLTRTRSLPQILNDLRQVKTKKIVELYTHIYREAWRLLNANGRLLLQVMYAADEIGFDADDMQSLSELDDALFWEAVDELAKRALLEVHGSISNRRYRIHRLTASFLQTEIINWPDEWDDTN